MALRLTAAILGVAAVLFPVFVIVTGAFMPIDDGSQPAYESLQPIAVCILVCGVLSLVGFIAGFAALRRTPPPRPVSRKLECLATSLPFVAYLALTTAFYVVFTAG